MEPGQAQSSKAALARRLWRGVNRQDLEALAAVLTPDAVFAVEGLFEIVGRRAALDLWRRAMRSYATLSIQPLRLVVSGATVLAEEAHHFQHPKREPFSLASMTVIGCEADRVVEWRHFMDVSGAAEDEQALWRRLRSARW